MTPLNTPRPLPVVAAVPALLAFAACVGILGFPLRFQKELSSPVGPQAPPWGGGRERAIIREPLPPTVSE